MSFAPLPIVALHGFTGRGTDWAALRDRMKGRAWLTPDLPGHGPAPGVAPADLPAHRAAITRARSFFSEPPVLLGYSMGGRVALHAALAEPEAWSALVLIGASPGLENETERATRRASDEALAGRILKMNTEDFLTEWDAQPLLAGRTAMPEPWRTRSLEARRKNTPAGLAASLAGVGTGAIGSLWESLGELRIPTLVLAGERDAKFSAIGARMAKVIPGAAFEPVPDAGHAAHMENPDATGEIVSAWLAGVTADGP